jgi:sugar phosphate isomerase/epimerase
MAVGITPGEVLLGTVALEPNRWATIDPSGAASTRLATVLDTVAAAGFDGLEVWERHLLDATEPDVDAIIDGPLPVSVFNTYVSFDGDDPDAAAARSLAAAWVRRSGAAAVKFNVGNDPSPDAPAAYARRLAAWIDELPSHVVALCECHAGISIAEDPQVAAAIFDAAAPPDRLQAIVHTHESAELVQARFDAYGNRITHVHVNHLDPATLQVPHLGERRRELSSAIGLLERLGFNGSFTLEFVHGVLTADDHLAHLLAEALDDLTVLRAVLAEHHVGGPTARASQ